jgi:hypothetical protein
MWRAWQRSGLGKGSSWPGCIRSAQGTRPALNLAAPWVWARRLQHRAGGSNFKRGRRRCEGKFSMWLQNFFFSYGTGVWTQGPHLDPHHQPYFYDGFFWDRISQVICLGWLQTKILLVSASWVVKVYRCEPLAPSRSKFWLTSWLLFYENNVKTLKEILKEN